MPVKLPKSNTQFNTYSNTDLSTLTTGIIAGLTATIASFPTPPVPTATLTTLLASYNTAMANAVDGSKQATAAFNAAKFNLQNALRQDSLYVSQIIATLTTGGLSYSDAQSLILQTGYALSKDPTPAGPLPAPVIKKYSSPKKGQFSILLVRVPNAKGYEVKLGNTTTGEILGNFSFTSTRILFTGLTSGDEYNATIASIGSNPTRNFDVFVSQFII